MIVFIMSCLEIGFKPGVSMRRLACAVSLDFMSRVCYVRLTKSTRYRVDKEALHAAR